MENDEDSGKAPDLADDADAVQDTTTVTAPPPSAPTAFPLENQLRDTPARTETETNRASADQKEDQGIDVPAQKMPKKRGFFARLFGKDRPHEEESAPDNRGRRYRDISDPEAN